VLAIWLEYTFSGRSAKADFLGAGGNMGQGPLTARFHFTLRMGSCVQIPPMQSMHSHRSRGGFSLLELLVVVAVIALLAGLAASGLQGREGAKLRSAQEALISQVQAARNTALAKNAACRLLVDAGADQENGRRRLALAVKSASDPTKWEVLGVPVKLPDGTALLVGDGATPSSTQGGTADAPQILEGSTLLGSAAMTSARWYFLEFDPSGTCEDNASAILLVGSVRHDGTAWIRKNPDMIRGVMVRRSGQASAFIDPEHIREAYDAL
jgi:prepilin-type N-terminal cleavage/methylation domain-containing protein